MKRQRPSRAVRVPQALEKHLAPRLGVTGGTAALQQFGEFINKQPLEKGTDIFMLWRGSETLEVVVKPTGSVNLAQAIRCPSLHKLFCAFQSGQA